MRRWESCDWCAVASDALRWCGGDKLCRACVSLFRGMGARRVPAEMVGAARALVGERLGTLSPGERVDAVRGEGGSQI